ncbi:sensor histidine kinase [Polymorphospora rubra]|uniref:sensor histidine kinase n=1 Tax=Polymorphospora rubra TaxID=338584 RepID=UPI0031DE40D0
MSTGPTSLPGNGTQEHGARRRGFPRLRDTRIRSKLALILVVPVAAVMALAGIRLVDVVQEADAASIVRSLTALSIDVSALNHDVHQERMAAAALLAAPSPQADAFNLAVRRTDERIAAYESERRAIGEIPASVDDRLDVIDSHLATLTSTRQQILENDEMPVAEVVLRYGVILTDLVSYTDALAQLSGDDGVGRSLRAVAAFIKAKAATAEEQAVAFAALTSGQLDEEQYSSFVATLTSQQEALLAFSLAATPEQQNLVEFTVTGDAVVLADQTSTELTRSVGGEALITAVDASNTIGAVNDLMRWAEIQLESDLLAEAEEVTATVIRQAITEAVIVFVTLVLAIVLAVILARSLNRSLRKLREGALSVANHDLPDAVSRLRDVRSIGEGGVDEIVRQVRDPIKLDNRDEVGQVASAFNVVHREAVRIAAEQAALRTSVSAMFLTLARRSQTLVDRMIGELDMIERGEEDPKRLAQLFELDHLATRMRRNDENLLVLAGADSTAPRRDDALLVDILRAAQSEVELYNRIEFGTVDTDISVAAQAVNDVVRLVAELLDNATRFSPPHTTVVADARRIRDYVVIQVEDRGLGLSADQMDSLNRRLAEPPTVDVAAFRLMGLAVVSRLAHRYEIRVELRRNVEGGTVAQVTLPAAIVVLPTRGQQDNMLPRPRQPLAVDSAPAPVPPAPAAGSGWSDTMAPVNGARTSSATLPDEWRPQQPATWDAPAQPRSTVPPVTAALPAVAEPTAAQPSLAPPALPVRTPQAPHAIPPAPFAPAVPQAPITPPAPAVPPVSAPPSVGTPTVAYPAVQQSLPRRPEGGVVPATPHALPPVAGLPAGPIAGLPAGPAAGFTPTQPPPAAPVAPPVVPAQAAPPPSSVPPLPPRPEDAAEMPIFREMEAVWFRSHGSASTEIFQVPPGGYDSPPPPATAPPVASGPIAGRGMPGGNGSFGAGDPTRAPLPARTPGQSTPPSAEPQQSYPQRAYPQSAATPPPAAPAEPVAPAQPLAATPPPAVPQQRGGDAGWRTAADEGWSRATRAAEPEAAGTTRSGLPKRVPQAQLVPGGVEANNSRDRARRTPDEVRGLLSAYHRGVQRGRTAGNEQFGSTDNKETS